jgi:pyruvate/2-oxoglutarate dehydrogenase complex dihydrolipoamide dehydrogenase (E3) component
LDVARRPAAHEGVLRRERIGEPGAVGVGEADQGNAGACERPTQQGPGIAASYESTVVSFADGEVIVDGPEGRCALPADAVYVLIGYEPDMSLLEAAGIEIDPRTLEPAVDPTTGESNVPGLYVAGTLQAGRDTNRIFIENSRIHSRWIVEDLAARLGR